MAFAWLATWQGFSTIFVLAVVRHLELLDICLDCLIRALESGHASTCTSMLQLYCVNRSDTLDVAAALTWLPPLTYTIAIPSRKCIRVLLAVPLRLASYQKNSIPAHSRLVSVLTLVFLYSIVDS